MYTNSKLNIEMRMINIVPASALSPCFILLSTSVSLKEKFLMTNSFPLSSVPPAVIQVDKKSATWYSVLCYVSMFLLWFYKVVGATSLVS